MQALQILPKADTFAPETKVHLPTPKLIKLAKEHIPKPPSVPVHKSGSKPKTAPTYGMTNPALTPKHKKNESVYYA
jgi:hypothetical protein